MSSTPQPTAPRPWWKMTDEEYNQHYRKASDAYYLLPVFLTWIGSAIIYILLKDEDPKKAKKGAILGIVLTVVFIAIPVGLWSYFYIDALRPQTLEEFNQEWAEDEQAYDACVERINNHRICADVHLRG